VVLVLGLLEKLDEEEARRSGADAVLKKPFEASVVMETMKRLTFEAQLARGLFAEAIAAEQPRPEPPAFPPAPPPEPVVDPERVRAAITIALDAALPALIREITERVLVALGH
jgi:CheY-like chemotaxis protein